ncbi:MAG TPA: chemotaxis protein CheW [Bacillota bacterium]|nr:chemotaxis protein CheW [Bacillota bacterium]
MLSVNSQEQIIIFSIQDECYALTINHVVEIIRVQNITEVPMTRNFIAGVMNLRGKIIPVVNFRERFRLPSIPFNKKTRVVVVSFEGELVGLIVDEIRMVTTLHGSELEATPSMVGGLEKECFEGFLKNDEMLIGILRLEKVLRLEEEVITNG